MSGKLQLKVPEGGPRVSRDRQKSAHTLIDLRCLTAQDCISTVNGFNVLNELGRIPQHGYL